MAIQKKSKSRSKSNKRKKQNEKTKKSTEGDNTMCLTPFSGRRASQKESPGAPWVRSTPATRMASLKESVSEDKEQDLPLPPQPELPKPPLAPSLPQEVKGRIAELKKSMGAGFTKELEDSIVAAALAAPNASSAAKPIITHGDVNKVSQARKQFEKAKTDLAEIDAEWKSFAAGLKLAYDRELEDYKVLRAQALEEVRAKAQKVKELQEAIKQSALAHNAEEEEIEAIPVLEDAYQIPDMEDAIPSEDEELMVADGEQFAHRPKAFGRFSVSPTRKAENQEGSATKKSRATLGGQKAKGDAGEVPG